MIDLFYIFICQYAMKYGRFSNRSSHQRCSVKKVILKNFTKFTGKEPVPESLF